MQRIYIIYVRAMTDRYMHGPNKGHTDFELIYI